METPGGRVGRKFYLLLEIHQVLLQFLELLKILQTTGCIELCQSSLRVTKDRYLKCDTGEISTPRRVYSLFRFNGTHS